MKKYVVLTLAVLLSTSCNSQEKNKEEPKRNEEATVETPKGSWKVNKEFDEDGNLIHYDSIYSWSSSQNMDKLYHLNHDSVLNSLQSRFYKHFSNFDLHGNRFSDLFAEDSLFTKRFFNDDFFKSDFGRDFIDIDKMRKRMETMQNDFLEKYRLKFHEDEKENTKKEN